MKLLLDMNLAPRWVQWLREAGVDAIHWTEVGAPTAPDASIFDYAQQNGLTVFTHDLDFGVLLAHTPKALKQVRFSPSTLRRRAYEFCRFASDRFLAGKQAPAAGYCAFLLSLFA